MKCIFVIIFALKVYKLTCVLIQDNTLVLPFPYYASLGISTAPLAIVGGNAVFADEGSVFFANIGPRFQVFASGHFNISGGQSGSPLLYYDLLCTTSDQSFCLGVATDTGFNTYLVNVTAIPPNTAGQAILELPSISRGIVMHRYTGYALVWNMSVIAQITPSNPSSSPLMPTPLSTSGQQVTKLLSHFDSIYAVCYSSIFSFRLTASLSVQSPLPTGSLFLGTNSTSYGFAAFQSTAMPIIHHPTGTLFTNVVDGQPGQASQASIHKVFLGGFKFNSDQPDFWIPGPTFNPLKTAGAPDGVYFTLSQFTNDVCAFSFVNGAVQGTLIPNCLIANPPGIVDYTSGLAFVHHSSFVQQVEQMTVINITTMARLFTTTFSSFIQSPTPYYYSATCFGVESAPHHFGYVATWRGDLLRFRTDTANESQSVQVLNVFGGYLPLAFVLEKVTRKAYAVSEIGKLCAVDLTIFNTTSCRAQSGFDLLMPQQIELFWDEEVQQVLVISLWENNPSGSALITMPMEPTANISYFPLPLCAASSNAGTTLVHFDPTTRSLWAAFQDSGSEFGSVSLLAKIDMSTMACVGSLPLPLPLPLYGNSPTICAMWPSADWRSMQVGACLSNLNQNSSLWSVTLSGVSIYSMANLSLGTQVPTACTFDPTGHLYCSLTQELSGGVIVDTIAQFGRYTLTILDTFQFEITTSVSSLGFDPYSQSVIAWGSLGGGGNFLTNFLTLCSSGWVQVGPSCQPHPSGTTPDGACSSSSLLSYCPVASWTALPQPNPVVTWQTFKLPQINNNSDKFTLPQLEIIAAAGGAVLGALAICALLLRMPHKLPKRFSSWICCCCCCCCRWFKFDHLRRVDLFSNSHAVPVDHPQMRRKTEMGGLFTLATCVSVVLIVSLNVYNYNVLYFNTNVVLYPEDPNSVLTRQLSLNISIYGIQPGLCQVLRTTVSPAFTSPLHTVSNLTFPVQSATGQTTAQLIGCSLTWNNADTAMLPGQSLSVSFEFPGVMAYAAYISFNATVSDPGSTALSSDDLVMGSSFIPPQGSIIRGQLPCQADMSFRRLQRIVNGVELPQNLTALQLSTAVGTTQAQPSLMSDPGLRMTFTFVRDSSFAQIDTYRTQTWLSMFSIGLAQIGGLLTVARFLLQLFEKPADSKHGDYLSHFATLPSASVKTEQPDNGGELVVLVGEGPTGGLETAGHQSVENIASNEQERLFDDDSGEGNLLLARNVYGALN